MTARRNGSPSYAETACELARVREQLQEERALTRTLKHHVQGHKDTIRHHEGRIRELEDEIAALKARLNQGPSGGGKDD